MDLEIDLRFGIVEDLRWFADKLGVEACTLQGGLTKTTYRHIIQKATELVSEKLILDEVVQHHAKIPTKCSLANCKTRMMLVGAYQKTVLPYFGNINHPFPKVDLSKVDLSKVDTSIVDTSIVEVAKARVVEAVVELRKSRRSFHIQFLDLLVQKMEDPEFFFDFVRQRLKLPRLPQAKRKRPARSKYSSIIETPSFIRFLKQVEGDDHEMKILNVKAKTGRDPSPRDLMHLLLNIRYNKTIEVLYIYNLGSSFTDEVMKHTIWMLQHNKNIWAVNIGENEQVSEGMWDEFAKALRKTNICFLYAGSECIVNEDLKKAMIDAARENRERVCGVGPWWEENKETLRKVINMWWNPSKSKHFKRLN